MCFFQRFQNIPDSRLSLFSLGVSVCTHTRQVEHQRCSSTGRVQKNHNILRKNTILNVVTSLSLFILNRLIKCFYSVQNSFQILYNIAILRNRPKNKNVTLNINDNEGNKGKWSIMYKVFIKYCVFFGDFKIFLTLAFLRFPSVSLCVHTPGR